MAVHESASGWESYHPGNLRADTPPGRDPGPSSAPDWHVNSILRAIAGHKGVARETIIADLR